MRALVRKVLNGFEGVGGSNATIIDGDSYRTLRQHAEEWANGADWKMEVWHDGNNIHCNPNRKE